MSTQTKTTMPSKSLAPANEVVAAIVADVCARDPERAKELAADPKGALEKAAEATFPAELTVRTVRNKADEVNVVIPAYPALDSMDMHRVLSDAELKKIAGGELIFAGLTAVGAFFGVTAAAGIISSSAVAGAAIVGTAAVGGATVLAGGAAAGIAAGGVLAAKKKKKK